MSEKDFADSLQETEDLVAPEPEQVEVEAKEPEKTLTVSELNALIKKAKWKGERKMQDKVEQLLAENEQLKAQMPQAQAPQAAAPQQTLGGMQQVSPEALKEQIRQEMLEQQRQLQQEQMQQEIQQVASQFYNKMAQGKELYDDFDTVVSDFDAAAFPQLVFLANEADNTAAIIYDLQKNPTKLASLAVLVERSPQQARKELAKLSASIKANQDAVANAKETPSPLSRLKPTTMGADGDKMGVRDFKNASFLRG